MLGADEAGKGPVLGPMVAAAVRADPAAIPDDVDDSKRLSPARREELDAALRDDDRVAVGVARVTVDRIDDPATDMNTLTVAGQAEALAAVARDGDRAVVDAGDVSESRFADRVADAVAAGDTSAGGTEADDGAADATGTDGDADPIAGVAVDVTAEHGADESYPVVAAASVVAKVERDRIVAELDAAYRDRGYDGIGSGYPSDPTTREFLREYVAREGDLPECARTSWSTCDDVLAANEQSALGEF
ncbi:ribonuclease HII [Halobaculum magnesiiphilum]|uniref:Ribonuclease n=1 Tax=Halobaculum magnesiiphilum TaxID=1017351 RepID=A0A8T8WGK5_9EURY|nr:ribonuclease HII [Halobaculum magnesiiphilum]QZP38968.1 ribonuclease HII [Halobaculum magnesiiphilum]